MILPILGFLAPFLPEVLGLFRDKMDKAHELKMLALQIQMADKQHQYKLEEIAVNRDIEEMRLVHQPQQSFGVQLLDAAHGRANKFITSLMLLLYGFLDLAIGMVRPSITFLFFALYAAMKLSVFSLLGESTGRWEYAFTNLWTAEDFEIFFTILAFWFGNRTKDKYKNGH